MVAYDGRGEELRVGVGVDLNREGMLRKVRGKKFQGGIRRVAGGSLEERKGVGERSSVDGGVEERVEDVTSLGRGSYEGGRAVMGS